ncbi:MAG: IS21-like element helper ATPase IstB [Longimicrobiales bacterium]
MNAQLEAKMKQIRLSGMVQSLPARVAQAQGGQLTHLEFLEILVADELAVRGDRLFLRRLKQAGITEVKDFSDFNWSFNPKLPRTRLCELATARFLREHANVLLVGPPGVGKSHSVTAIAIGAIRAGHRVLIKNIFALADELLDADATHTRRTLVDQLSTVDLFVLEDFGMKTLRASVAEDLLDIIMRRHGRLSTIITTNRPTEDWAKFLNDVPAATAILDRFLEHIEIIMMEGRSYRLANHRSPAITPDHAAGTTAEASLQSDAPASQPAPTPTPSKSGRRTARTAADLTA